MSSPDEGLGSVGARGIVGRPAADKRGVVRNGSLAVELVTPNASAFENVQAGSTLLRGSRVLADLLRHLGSRCCSVLLFNFERLRTSCISGSFEIQDPA